MPRAQNPFSQSGDFGGALLGLDFIFKQQRRGGPGQVHHRIPGAEKAVVDLIPHASCGVAGQGDGPDGKAVAVKVLSPLQQ